MRRIAGLSVCTRATTTRRGGERRRGALSVLGVSAIGGFLDLEGSAALHQHDVEDADGDALLVVKVAPAAGLGAAVGGVALCALAAALGEPVRLGGERAVTRRRDLPVEMAATLAV